MSSKNTEKATGAKVATSKEPKNGRGKSIAKVPAHYELLPQQEASDNGSQIPTAEMEGSSAPEGTETPTKNVEAAAAKAKPKKVVVASAKTKPKKAEAATAKPKKVEAAAAKSKIKKAETATAKGKPKKVEAAAAKSGKVVQKKAVSSGKDVAVGNKKVKLASSTYHYYRSWLKDFIRSYGGGVPSARFQKSPESYEGHIIISETEKAKGLKALEQWSKQNPDTRELFWDVKK